MNSELRSLRERQLATLEAREEKDQSCLDTIVLIKEQLCEQVGAAAAALAGAERAELEQLRARNVELEQLYANGVRHRDELANDVDLAREQLAGEISKRVKLAAAAAAAAAKKAKKK